MTLHVSNEPLFIFNKENIRAYLTNKYAWLSSLSNSWTSKNILDPDKPLTSDKIDIQSIKKSSLRESSTIDIREIFSPNVSASHEYVDNLTYIFFVNPKAIPESLDFGYDASVILMLPPSLQAALLESSTRWQNYSLSLHQNGFPFGELHAKAISLAFLDKVCAPNGLLNALRSPDAQGLPRKFLEQTAPVIASLKDFDLFITLNKTPNPEISAWLKKVIIKDSFRKFYTKWRTHPERFSFLKKEQLVPTFSNQDTWPDQLKAVFDRSDCQQGSPQELSYRSLPQSDEDDVDNEPER